jgi:hypothetical protein
MKNAQANGVRRICTPNWLAHALAWNNGIANSIVQLISLDRPELPAGVLQRCLKRLAKESRRYLLRANEILFPKPAVAEWEYMMNLDWSDFEACRQVINNTSISFRAQACTMLF